MAGRSSRERGADAPGLVTLLVLSAWCGLFSGLLEVGSIVVRKRYFDLNQFYWTSRHFVWAVPLINLLIFLALGMAVWLLVLCIPHRGRRLSTRFLCAMTLLPPFWAAFPRIHALAGLILVAGFAVQLVPVLERHAAGLHRMVRVSFPLLACLVAALAASLWGADRLKAWREEARPLPPPGSPNVLWIVLDTVGADHLSLYGYPRPTSPTIEELAARGIRFDRAKSTSSWTLPSHSSMFTGRWPHELSAGWFTPLDGAYPTLAETLGSHGYATAGFVANSWYCATDTGLARGFTTLPGSFLSPAHRLQDGRPRRSVHGSGAGGRAFPRRGAGLRSPAARGGSALVAPDDESERGDDGQSRVSRLAVPAPRAGAALLRLPQLL